MTPRPDTDGDALRRRERAGSPSLAAIEGATTWQEIKSRFVDDPAAAIDAAEELVRRTVELRVRALENEATAMYAQGSDEDRSSTESLRTRLVRYQQFCERLARTDLH